MSTQGFSADEFDAIQAPLLGGDQATGEQFVAALNKLVGHIAGKIDSRHLHFDDRVQEGWIGAMQAAKRFDPAQGCKFSTYAMHWIRQAIMIAVKERDRQIRLPRNMIDTIPKITQANAMLAQTLGRPATEQELAEYVGIKPSRIRVILSPDAISINTPVSGGDETLTLADIEVSPDPGPCSIAMQNERYELVRTLLSILDDPEEVLALEHRFGLNGKDILSFREIGELLGMSLEGARKVYMRALRKLRRHADELR